MSRHENVVVNWNGNQVQAVIKDAIAKRLNEAGNMVKSEIKRLLSTPGHATKTTQSAKTGKISTRRVGALGTDRSKPGEPPRKQTGRLLRSVFKKKAGKNAVKVGARGNLMEYGAAHMDPRPFVATAMAKLKDAVTAVITKGIS